MQDTVGLVGVGTSIMAAGMSRFCACRKAFLWWLTGNRSGLTILFTSVYTYTLVATL